MSNNVPIKTVLVCKLRIVMMLKARCLDGVSKSLCLYDVRDSLRIGGVGTPVTFTRPLCNAHPPPSGWGVWPVGWRRDEHEDNTL